MQKFPIIHLSRGDIMAPYKNVNSENYSSAHWYSKLNFQFLTIIGLIAVIALINFYSITHTPSSPLVSVFWKQVLWMTLGFVIFFILSAIDYQFFCRFSYFFYGVNILALIAVLFAGQSFHGAQRWFDFGWFSYQPSETMKAALICVLASIFSKKTHSIRVWTETNHWSCIAHPSSDGAYYLST